VKIKLLAIGKTDDKRLQELIVEFQNRLKHYIKFEIEIIPDLKKVKNLSLDERKQKEGLLILNRIESTDQLILLDEKGHQFRSLEFSRFLQKKMNSGIKQLVFAIGGPYGFSDEVYQKAQGKVSLSKMTFSHQMIRLFMIEQLYRAFTILHNEPYHNE
jgi:23S rRNA (pseudouridine1915-N3)-methyltransferase